MPAYNAEEFIEHALKSIPIRDDIEVIVINDGSIDKTAERITYFYQKKAINLTFINRKENLGIGYSRREGLTYAKGEYIMMFDSDDNIVQENFNKALDMLTGEDIIYYDLKQNDGVILHLTPETKGIYPGADKFIKREYINQFEYPIVRSYEDVKFNGMLHSKPHTDKFTNLVVVNYNFPREDSTSAKWARGECL